MFDRDAVVLIELMPVKKDEEDKIMKLSERIEINPKVCNGKPVIKGTRIPVTIILDQIAEGRSWESILTSYPELTREDIQAALYYARTSLEHSEFEAVGG